MLLPLVTLHHIRGLQSFAELKTVESDLCNSFREACIRLGLPEDDNQYHLAMQEAAVSNSAASLRSLFAMILTWCEPSNPLDIYQHHKESLAEDFLHQQCTQLGNNDLSLMMISLTWHSFTCRIGCLRWEVENCLNMVCHTHR